jgi:hypothetical protein
LRHLIQASAAHFQPAATGADHCLSRTEGMGAHDDDGDHGGYTPFPPLCEAERGTGGEVKKP